MHNWRLLILAFLAVLRPIASFTERNLVDGREQCCDRKPSLLRDTSLSYGTTRFNKPSEDRRLSQQDETREDRRYEVRKDDLVLTRPTSERRLIEYRSERHASRITPELSTRVTRVGHRRFRVFDDHRRERYVSSDNNRIRDSRRYLSSDITNVERITGISGEHVDSRQRDRDSRESSIISRENNRIVRSFNMERQFRDMTDSRRENLLNREGSEEFRRVHDFRKIRNNPQRARIGVARLDLRKEHQIRGMVRVGMDERRAFTLSLESRLQLDNTRENLSLERRVRNNIDENRRSTSLEFRSNRNRNLKESRFGRDDARDVSYRLSSRQAVEKVDKRQNGQSMTIRRECREKSAERRLSRKAVDCSSDSVRSKRVKAALGSRNYEMSSRAYSREEKPTSESRRVESRMSREPSRIREERATSESRRVDSRTTRRETARNRDERVSQLRRVESRVNREFVQSREERATSESRRVESRKSRESSRILELRPISESRRVESRVQRELSRGREQRENSESRRVESRMTRREPARIIRGERALSEPRRTESRVDRKSARSLEERATSESRRFESKTIRETGRIRDIRENSESRRAEFRISREPSRNLAERAQTRISRESGQIYEERDNSVSQRVESQLSREPSQVRAVRATFAVSRRVESRASREIARSREQRTASEPRRIESRMTRESTRSRSDDRIATESRRVESRMIMETARIHEERAIPESRHVDSRLSREPAQSRKERTTSESRRIESRRTREARINNERTTLEPRRIESRMSREPSRIREEQTISQLHRLGSGLNRDASNRASRDNRREARQSRYNEEFERNISPIRNEYTRYVERRTESRFRSRDISRAHQNYYMIRENIRNDENTSTMDWQYLFYALQGIYICMILMQAENGSKKNSR